MINIKKLILIFLYLFLSCFCAYKLFSPIYLAEEIIISFFINPFDICYNTDLWNFFKISFIFFYIFSNFIIINSLFTKFIFLSEKYQKNKLFFSDENNININNSSLNLLIGKDYSTNSNIYLPESGLYQNFLITGTIRFW